MKNLNTLKLSAPTSPLITVCSGNLAGNGVMKSLLTSYGWQMTYRWASLIIGVFQFSCGTLLKPSASVTRLLDKLSETEAAEVEMNTKLGE